MVRRDRLRIGFIILRADRRIDDQVRSMTKGALMADEGRSIICSRCGGHAYVDSDGHRTPIATTGSSPCVCDEFEVPPHWER